MNRITYFIGIDVASEDFTAAILTTPGKPITVREQIPNTSDGFRSFEQWLKAHQVTLPNSVVCLEATGVYGQALCYYLAAKGYRVAVEPPLKVKRAFLRHRRGSISPAIRPMRWTAARSPNMPTGLPSLSVAGTARMN